MLLTNCMEQNGLAPVEELRWIPFNEHASYHIVRPNDTLFSIAFRYEKDYHQLARVNHLPPPYDITPGQRISLKDPPFSKKVSVEQKRVKQPPPFFYRTKGSLTLAWPVKGSLYSQFSLKSGQKGVDISVRKQQLVRAASSGVVAYSGDGIPRYGHLIILKHDQKYLTAYAHNSKNIVKEGDKVIKGQAIAYTGLINSNIRGLHFELRKNGKPLNPLSYLSTVSNG